MVFEKLILIIKLCCLLQLAFSEDGDGDGEGGEAPILQNEQTETTALAVTTAQAVTEARTVTTIQAVTTGQFSELTESTMLKETVTQEKSVTPTEYVKRRRNVMQREILTPTESVMQTESVSQAAKSTTSTLDNVTRTSSIEYLSWETWLVWTDCSSTCGGGQRLSIKLCSGANQNNCSFSLSAENFTVWYAIRTENCNVPVNPCPVDGDWVTWSEWSHCSSSCGNGVTQRQRVCDGPYFGGSACVGSSSEKQICILEQCGSVKPVSKNISLPVFTESDARPSAKSVAGICSVILTAMFTAIVVIDVPTLYKHTRYGCRRRVKKRNKVRA